MKLEKEIAGKLNISSQNSFVFYNVTETETLSLGKLFGGLLKSGDSVLLYGDIGSGKTFFSRAVIQNMMMRQRVLVEEVPSPTFTIVQSYDLLCPPVYHLDLYRLSNSDDIIELSLEDTLETSIYLIEWPDKMGSFLPKRNLSFSGFPA